VVYNALDDGFSLRRVETHLRVVACNVLWTHAIMAGGRWCWKSWRSIWVVASIG